MRLCFEFQLPEEEYDMLLACHAPELASAVSEITRWLRDKRKHGGLGDEAQRALDELWELVHKALEDVPERVWL